MEPSSLGLIECVKNKVIKKKKKIFLVLFCSKFDLLKNDNITLYYCDNSRFCQNEVVYSKWSPPNFPSVLIKM